jgi:hypothetical protein
VQNRITNNSLDDTTSSHSFCSTTECFDIHDLKMAAHISNRVWLPAGTRNCETIVTSSMHSSSVVSYLFEPLRAINTQKSQNHKPNPLRFVTRSSRTEAPIEPFLTGLCVWRRCWSTSSAKLGSLDELHWNAINAKSCSTSIWSVCDDTSKFERWS